MAAKWLAGLTCLLLMGCAGGGGSAGGGAGNEGVNDDTTPAETDHDGQDGPAADGSADNSADEPTDGPSGPADEDELPGPDEGDNENSTESPGQEPELDAEVLTLDVSLPSESTGDAGGPLAVRLHLPAADHTRYAEGAPIMVLVPGGHEAGMVSPDDEGLVRAAGDYGLIHVSYSMPGTLLPDVAGGSGGTYDYRGPACKRALADVLRFATGELIDSEGATIGDHLPFALTNNVGVAALSHGGNLALTTLADHGAEFARLAWLVCWESPIGDQYVTAELGGGHSGERLLNPYYTPGTSTLTDCPWPGMENVLAFDAEQEFALQDPADSEAYVLKGVFFLDENGDGARSDGEFSFSPLGGPGETVGGNHLPKGYTSLELAALIERRAAALFPDSVPAWLAPRAEVEAYWADRDGSLVLEQAHAALPDMAVMAVAGISDHVQAQPDHPHVRGFVNGWLDAGGRFVRLNPDSAYMAVVSGADAAGFPDNDANQPIPYPGIDELLQPRTVTSTTAMTAALLEMADRVREGNLSVNLDAVLVP